jgi:chromosomal replication initiation ATPase DnaA
MPGQLVLPFGVRSAQAREDFIVAPCNEQAFRFIERWPDWPARIAALYGPSGCGKTHLASVWQTAARALWVRAGELSPEMLPALAGEPAVAVEDLDTVSPSEQRDRALLTLFERPAGWLLFTAKGPPPEWPAVIGDLISRFHSLLAFPMWAPDETLLSQLVRKHFADRQLEVPEMVTRRILIHIERTPEAVAAFVASADRKALSEKRAVSERLVLELIEAENETKRV